MGITMFSSGLSEKSISLLQITSASTEEDFIIKLQELTSRTYSGQNGTYQATGVEEIGYQESYTSYLPKVSPVKNFVLSSSTDTRQTVTEDETYIYLNTAVTLVFQHNENTSTIDNEYEYVLGQIIGLRKNILENPCCWRVKRDNYSGSKVIRVTFQFLQKREKQEEIPVPVNPITSLQFGAFPTGIGADYCWIICKTDEAYQKTLATDTLNQMANDYAAQVEPDSEKGDYYGVDENGIYVLVKKDAVDSSEELKNDWNSLHGEPTLSLQNEVNEYVVDGQTVECYKVYIGGQCQLIEFDGMSFLREQGGTTEVPQYDLPNGYYVIVGDQLRLFLLTTIDSAEYPYNDTQVKFNENSTIGNGVCNIDNRKTYTDNRYYVYIGQKTNNIEQVNKDTILFSGTEIQNLRKMTFSNTITSLGHLGGVANPDKGFYFPKYLEYIGPLTINYTAGTSVYVPCSNLKVISDNAFYDGTSVDTNLRLYLCENPEDVATTMPGGIFQPSEALVSIGKEAIYGLSFSEVDLTKCTNLQQVGKLALATSSGCKIFKFLHSQISQNADVVNKNLIYLPDQAQELIDTIGERSGNYDSSSYSNALHETLGYYLSGYTISLK